MTRAVANRTTKKLHERLDRFPEQQAHKRAYEKIQTNVSCHGKSRLFLDIPARSKP
jgi:hypothetical protein